MASDLTSKLNAAVVYTPGYPGFVFGTTDGDGDFDGGIDADVKSVGGKAR